MAAGIFSYQKLKWMNSQYVRSMPDSQLADRLLPVLINSGQTLVHDFELQQLGRIVPHIKERMELLNDVPVQLEFLFKRPFERDLQQMVSKHVEKAQIGPILDLTADKFENLKDFSAPAIETSLKEVVDTLGLQMGGVFICVRVAILGKKATPPLAPSIEILGKDEAIKRLKEAKVLVESL